MNDILDFNRLYYWRAFVYLVCRKACNQMKVMKRHRGLQTWRFVSNRDELNTFFRGVPGVDDHNRL